MNDMLRELADGSREIAGRLGAQIVATAPGRDRNILRSLQNRFLRLAEEAESWAREEF